MRIKRIARLGAAVLVGLCLCLYLTLDRTLTLHSAQNSGTPEGLALNYANRPELRESMVKWGFRDRDEIICPLNTPDPPVNIQMGEVYDHLEFDDIDGGVWKQGWDIHYNEDQWTRDNKLKIFLVPHSHNDPGWKKTFEEYYQSQTRSILTNMVKKLMEDERRKFIWAEVSFFSLFWSEVNEAMKQDVRTLVSRGQLEFVAGGWVMPDEANSHYYSLIQQFIHGHHWLSTHLNYTPKYSWSIDPFGLSPTMSLLLQKMDFDGLVVQRAHYSVKKYLAHNRQLEFRWTQLWEGDKGGWMLTHLMPFYSYDVPHTCGPDPKVCCQFDFRRLPGFGVSCPWRFPPQRITSINVQQRALLLLDQYRKKAQLFRTNVLLVPLGDDFRYETAPEWDAQYNNYRILFDYINSTPQLNAKAEIGTLHDYFKALKEEKKPEEFPSLSGDFFTYADRNDHYWSGYYTSRPLHKRLDRVLQAALRSGEILTSMGVKVQPLHSLWNSLMYRLSLARAALSLFQHHDGITGTAKDHVVIDYANKMLEVLAHCHYTIQQAAYFLLSEGKVAMNKDEVYFALESHDKMSQWGTEAVMDLDGVPLTRVTLFNSLTSVRREVVSVKVNSHLVRVMDSDLNQVGHQVSPYCHLNLSLTPQCYLLSFPATVPPLSLVTYSVLRADDDGGSLSTLKLVGWKDSLPDWPMEQVQRETRRRGFSLETDGISLGFSKKGLLASVTFKLPDSALTVPVQLSFASYDARPGEERSGAYLFLPAGKAKPVVFQDPPVCVIQGSLFSRVLVRLPNIIHSITVFNSPGADGKGIEIQNLVDISPINNNYEVAMKFTSGIKNGPVFFTDLNGIQIIKRKRQAKIPLQGNFYPMPTSSFIEDPHVRLTLLSGQPLGVASLAEGELEVMLDRRLMQDDNRGLSQGVMDNKPTLNVFRLHIEPLTSTCYRDERATWGQLSMNTVQSSESLLYPLDRLIWQKAGEVSRTWTPDGIEPSPAPLHLVTAMPLGLNRTGIVLLTQAMDTCIEPTYPHSSSINIELNSLFPMRDNYRVYKSGLSFNNLKSALNSALVSLCRIDLQSFIISMN